MLDSSDIAEFNESIPSRKPTDRQREIVDYLVSTNSKVAEASIALDMDRSNIYRELRKPHVKRYMYEQLIDTLTLGSVRAANQLTKLIDHKSGYISLEASKEVLNRAGITTVQRKEVSVTGGVNVHIDLS